MLRTTHKAVFVEGKGPMLQTYQSTGPLAGWAIDECRPGASSTLPPRFPVGTRVEFIDRSAPAEIGTVLAHALAWSADYNADVWCATVDWDHESRHFDEMHEYAEYALRAVAVERPSTRPQERICSCEGPHRAYGCEAGSR